MTLSELQQATGRGRPVLLRLSVALGGRKVRTNVGWVWHFPEQAPQWLREIRAGRRSPTDPPPELREGAPPPM